MRLTIKAKLASAFGVVTILSITVGAIAYTKLSALDTSQQNLVVQAERMKKGADLMNEITAQVRAELRMILAASDADTAEGHRLMMDRQQRALKIRDELYGIATEQGKRILDQAATKMKRMNELQQEAGKFALLNSSNRAAALWAAGWRTCPGRGAARAGCRAQTRRCGGRRQTGSTSGRVG